MAERTLQDKFAEFTRQLFEADHLAREGMKQRAEMATKLESLKAQATKQYSLRNYTAAADLYSEASELQDEINGEMSPENADLLYAYGRCLYHVAVAQSDVLGGKVAGEEPKKKKRKTKAENGDGTAAANESSDATKSGEQKLAEDVVEAAVEEKEGMKKKEEPSAANKPYFQITGDENWTDSENEEDGEGGEEGAEGEEEQDDFAIAYEILDVARVLLSRKLEGPQEHEGKGKQPVRDDTPERRQIMERLADTHDLQAEISLENERFEDAVSDAQAALELKLKLFPQESSLVAEAHYKLSLALEFASVTTSGEDGEAGVEKKSEQVDEGKRKEAAEQMEAAIASCKLRVSKEQALLSSLDASAAQEKEKSIKEVQEILADMEQRVSLIP